MFYEVGMLDQFVVANKCVEVGLIVEVCSYNGLVNRCLSAIKL